MIKLFSCGLVVRKETKAAKQHPSIAIVTNWEIIIRGRPISLFRGPIRYRLLEIKEIENQ